MEPGNVEELVGAFIERRERGEALTPEDFAREHPEGGAELVAALRALAEGEALFPTGAPDLPSRIGPYLVHGEIGRGGMGRVLEVSDPARPGERIALKLLHVSLGHQPRALERFKREGQALQRLDHPWIVRVHAAGLLDGRPYLAMQKVDGTSLAEHVRRARERIAAGAPASHAALELPGEGTPLERVARLCARLARAVASAHREGVLHRDLNPRNVLVRPDGEPVVIDFGLMRASGTPTLTGSGDLLGTPQYMAPEQARGERVDERTDVFGLGTILRELLTLEPPRTAEDTLALVHSASGRPLGGFPRQPVVPRELETVARRATAFFPRWRHPSCEALARDLELFLEGEPILSRPPGPVQRLAEGLHVHRRVALAAGVGVLALGVGLALRGEGPEDVHRRRAQGTTTVVLAWLTGDLDGARRALDDYRAQERDPPYAQYLDALIAGDLARAVTEPTSRAMLAGQRALEEGRAKEALASFDTAWDLVPDIPVVLLMRGLAALESGDLESARTALQVSATPFGRAPRLHAALATLYERLEQPLDARRALNAAVALAPDDGELWLREARLAQRLGSADDALRAARKALQLDPSLAPSAAELATEWERLGAAEAARALRASL